MKRFARVASSICVAIEWIVTTPIFFLSWWLCSIARAAINGWTMSGSNSGEKRKALGELWGAE